MKTINELITVLQQKRAEMGNCDVCIEDADEGSLLLITEVEKTDRLPNMLQIGGNYHNRLAR